MGYLDISEVAKRTGMPASALRYYEEKGLVTSIGRRGLKRLFDPDVLERLALIALGRAAGFTLDEIGEMFAADGKPQIDRRALADKADQLDARIRKLESMRDGLRHAAACKAPSHLECPKFRRLMGLAASDLRRRPSEPVAPAESGTPDRRVTPSRFRRGRVPAVPRGHRVSVQG